MQQKQQVLGALAEFETTSSLYHACERVRDAGYSDWDAHTPFPVHGLDAAMGIKASRVPWICLVTGLGGAVAAFLLQWWVHEVEYPLVIAAKPFFSWPASCRANRVSCVWRAMSRRASMDGLERAMACSGLSQRWPLLLYRFF